LKEIAGIVSKMSKAGIRVEVCLFAAKVFEWNPLRSSGNPAVGKGGYRRSAISQGLFPGPGLLMRRNA